MDCGMLEVAYWFPEWVMYESSCFAYRMTPWAILGLINHMRPWGTLIIGWTCGRTLKKHTFPLVLTARETSHPPPNHLAHYTLCLCWMNVASPSRWISLAHWKRTLDLIAFYQLQIGWVQTSGLSPPGRISPPRIWLFCFSIIGIAKMVCLWT